jgi:CzcA family heavy metal efflux pump
MRRLVDLCLRFSGTVAALTLLALVVGGWLLRGAPLDVFPDFVPSTVDIQTEAPGFTAEQVEQLVTRPIESQVNGATGLATIRSESIPGLSLITIQFNDNIDPYTARQGVSELLQTVTGELPLGVGPPQLSPLTSSTMDLLKIGLVSDRLDPFQLRDTAEWIMKPALLAVPGVAHVLVFGGAEREIDIQPDLRRMTSYGFMLTDLADAARQALALRGAGFVDVAHQRVLIQTPIPSPDPTAIANAVVGVRNNIPITIADIATVRQERALRSGDSLIMGRPGVLLSLASQYGANTLDTTRRLETALHDMLPALKAQGITVYPALHRPANFVEVALHSLEHSLVIAAVLILVVLYLFLRDWRSAFITFLAIPLSLLAAAALLDKMGDTLNTMTLGGFAVALGVLVDDAIIGIENILRRLHENAGTAAPRPRLSVIAEATLEVRGPVIFATLVVIAIFLPVLFSSSVQGHFLGPLALAFILAVLASLLVALTATPAFAALMLRARDYRADAAWIRKLKTWQASAVEAAQRRLAVAGAVVTLATVAALVVLPFLPSSFMPDFREGHFVMQVSSSVPGTSLDEMMAVGERISRDVLKLPYVATIEQQIGRAQLGEDTWGTHQSEFHVELKKDATVDQAQAEQALRDILAHYPGLQSEVVTFLGDRISESLTGETADIAIKLFGNQLDALDRAGHQVAAAISTVPGVADVQFGAQSATPTFILSLDPAAMAASGLKTQDVLDAVGTDFSGLVVGQTYAGIRSVNVSLLLSPKERNDPATFEKVMIQGPFGPVPLSAVARITNGQSRYLVSHDGGQRYVSITFNVVGRGLQATSDAVQAKVAALHLPSGIYPEFAGAAAEARAGRNQMILYSALALALIAMILAISFQWRSNTFLVLINMPFCLIGSVAAIVLMGQGVSVGAMVGLVTVFGISARNAILLLAHYEHLVDAEGAGWGRQTVLRGAQERLVPILMTAAVTALGLLPLAIGLHAPGQEIEGPMAVTVLGGLLTSTILNLVLLPACVERLGGPRSG